MRHPKTPKEMKNERKFRFKNQKNESDVSLFDSEFSPQILPFEDALLGD